MSLTTESFPQDCCAIDTQLPESIWHKSAPRAVLRAFQAGRKSTAWKAWCRHLLARKHPVALGELFAGDDQTLLWGLDLSENPAFPLFFPPLANQPIDSQNVHRWLRDASGGEFQLEYALSALGWGRDLPRLAAVLSAGDWWRVLHHLLRTSREASASNLDRGLSGDKSLVHQLLAGELALTLAYLFPEIKACRAILPESRRALSMGIVDALDGEGLLHAKSFDQFRPLLACWTRCRALGDQFKRGCWNSAAEQQYRHLVRNTLRLTRRNGSHVFSSGSSAERSDTTLLAAALKLGGNTKDCAMAAMALGVKKIPGNKSNKTPRADNTLPTATIHSEWATAAVLRPDWSKSSPRLTVLYPGTSCRVELSSGRDVLFSGEWGFEARVAGKSTTPVSEWSETCWISDDDVDYLELEITLSEGLRVQRHMLLARKDRFLLLADAVLGARPAEIQYRGTLPLDPRVTFRGDSETSEGVLVGRKPRAAVLPLALSEWLSAREGNELLSTSAGLELRQTGEGCSLFAPLWIDLDRRRLFKPLTWRQLTVAESLAIQPTDVAAGYRVAIGRRQWLIYRSLTPPRNRTLLGHNLSSEMLVARFDRKGEVETLIEIE